MYNTVLITIYLALLNFIGIVDTPSNIDVAIEELGDRIESIEDLPNQNKLAIDRIDEKFDEKFEDQNEINQDIKQTLGNKIEGIVERIEPLEELSENIKTMEQRVRMNCPEGEQYKKINGVCYHFDKTSRTFDETQAYCEQIFGSLML